ncbi:hypothetical protein [Nonomuraea sediminis]|uniref:hypothetical protein n=1 Tax=Nonomuraea sediminis TaxID=2835864 RepID=UPI001BDC34C4|nr:hypothetical protein [Nonomuraea sediminis]
MKSRAAFVVAPLLVLAYGLIRIVDGFDGSRGPGIAWTTGHLAFLGALALFVPIFLEMRRMLGRTWPATLSVVVGVVGIACAGAQFAIDIVIGFMASSHEAMSPLFDQVRAVPGVSLAVYDAGPFLFYAAQLALVVQLAVARQVKWWTPVLVMLDFAVPTVNKDLIPLGALCLLVSFLPMIRRTDSGARHALAHA